MPPEPYCYDFCVAFCLTSYSGISGYRDSGTGTQMRAIFSFSLKRISKLCSVSEKKHLIDGLSNIWDWVTSSDSLVRRVRLLLPLFRGSHVGGGTPLLANHLSDESLHITPSSQWGGCGRLSTITGQSMRMALPSSPTNKSTATLITSQ